MSAFSAIHWEGDHLRLLDQRRLPAEEIYLECRDARAVADAIREMAVRGAPAIGISAAYGVALAARACASDTGNWEDALAEALAVLAASRPTAVNLFWALERCREVIAAGGDVPATLEQLALAIHREDLENNRRLGRHGAALLEPGSRVYTHCNTGTLATGGYGTALGVIRAAFEAGKLDAVIAGETRPWLQGARLTCWELMRDGIPVNLCSDGAAGHLMRTRGIDWVIVGADRIAANGDTANKIGTYNLAVLARHHGARFMVAAPTSTIDPATASGAEIPIEERDPAEVTRIQTVATAPPSCQALNPAFDVTPAELIDAIVTEKGVIEKPTRARIAAHLEK